MAVLEDINVNGMSITHTVIPIIGDGACLFNSLSFLLFNTQERSLEIRKRVVSYVVEKWNDFSWMSYNSNGDNFSTSAEYEREMSQHAVYAGVCELVAAGKIFPFCFEVYYNRILYETFGTNTFPVKRLRLSGNINSGHFDVYLPISELNVPIISTSDELSIPKINVLQDSLEMTPVGDSQNETRSRLGRRPKKIMFNYTRQSQEQIEQVINKKHGTSKNIITAQEKTVLVSVRPGRVAKSKSVKRIAEIISDLNDYYSQEADRKRKKQNNNFAVNSNRLHRMRNYANLRRTEESITERNQRLQKMRKQASQRRAVETIDSRQQRLEEDRRRHDRRLEALRLNHLSTYKIATTINTSYHSLKPFRVSCIHCTALHFPEERVKNNTHPDSFGDCCLHGRIDIAHSEFPNELVRLFLRRHPLSGIFHKRIRNLNACYALASFTVDDDRTINNRGIYSYIASGQVYHKLNIAAHPSQNSEGEFERPQYGQIYFLDNEDAVSERINNPINHGINKDLLNLLEHLLRSVNPFVHGFMMMREVEEEANNLAIAEGKQAPYIKLLFAIPDNVDHRKFNIPVQNEVCAVVTLNADQSFPENELVIRQRGKSLVTMKNIDNRVEPFTYPLFYPKGTFGFSLNLPLKTPYSSRQHVTRLELAQYRLAFRPGLAKDIPSEANLNKLDLRLLRFNALHFGGRLFQQYLVDTFIRVEQDRIQWIKANQKKLLADNYTGVMQFLNELAVKNNAVVGEKIILPSSFPGSTRYYNEHFEDAMGIVRRYGSPDFFITMTCNPDWPEFKEAARLPFEDGSILEQLAQDRPDLIARIAKLKFHDLIYELDKKQIFGKVSAFVYTIEFQMRGLPHMHLLLIMSPEDKIHNNEQLDDLISAEIPNSDDQQLRELVKKWMVHNPCGKLNPNAPCMVNKNGRMQCRFGFPKPHVEVTSLTDDQKPNYRRRYDTKLDILNPNFSHEHAIYRKDAENHRVTRDNRHISTYNPYLLKRYNCHINVEYVGSIRAVKYLYKYIYKGHDCAFIKVIEDQRRLNYNEADTFIQGRCITSPEACWRLFGNEIQKKSHTVQRLDIHLPGKYRIANLEQTQEDLADIGLKYSTLEAYFQHNRNLRHQHIENQQEVNYHYYWQMPEYFRWIGKTSMWVPRIKNIRIIGRIHSVNFVSQPELYHLRLLLYHVKDAIGFDDLLTVNGVKHATYKQACLARGLTYDDRQWIESLQESAISKMPRAMRTLFTQILIFGSPENPKALWETFRENLAEDFIQEARRNAGSVDEAIKRAYRIIAHKLNTEATEGRNFCYWVQRFNMDDIEDYENEQNQEILSVNENAALGVQMYELLKGRQLEIVNKILNSCNNEQSVSKCYFIDGPGGTGKTFVYKTLYYILSGQNKNVKCMAFTGIASILLPNGQTSHKTFGLKIPLTPESKPNIKPGSAKAKALAKIDVFLMDEAPMLPKYGLNNMDHLLRSIGNSNLPFGGKVVVLGGDFRQCLPVQPRANRSELVDLSLKKSNLWQYFYFFSLTENMRVDPDQRNFAEYLLKIGNGVLPANTMDEVELPIDIISNGNIIDEIFGDCLANNRYEDMKDRAILAPLNKEVNQINDEIIQRLPGEFKIYKSYDSVKDQPEGALQFTPEFLNSIEIADLPPHELKLKKNTIIMLLRNLDVSEGLCNGTRLIVNELSNNIIKAKIITGENSGRDVHIPRITLDSSKSQIGCTLQRHQFPIKPAFAITIHKAQGQTFERVGIYLLSSVFMHGMLYVAFSRVKRRSDLKVHLPQENNHHTRNVVWKEVLNNTENEEQFNNIDFFHNSSSNDLISRRGVFSRRHYGSVELLPQVEVNGQEVNGRRFRVENGDSLGEKEEIFGSPSTPVLENPEYQTRWYFKYFLGKLHQNYVGVDTEKVPFFLSVVLTDANSQCVPQYRAILWKKTGTQKISLPYLVNKPMTVKQILSNFPNMDKLEKGPKEIFTPDIQKDLLLLEEQEGSVNFKFGVLYTKPAQLSDDEMLSNETGSEEFDNFVALLGDKVRLKGWDKYRGGLDVKGDMTGRHSVYTIYEGHEIMFHVSTLLPYSKDNRQQVERKRHIGNDIVNIVYVDEGPTQMAHFNPSFIKSQFTHVFALVSYSSEDHSYRLNVYSEESVPLFGPSLPCPPIFRISEEFREFLIVKLINGEKASFNTPTFAQKRERTLDMLIKDLCSEHMSEANRGTGHMTMLNRRAFSDVLADPPRGSRRKEEARQVEFVRIGQALKLDTIVKGDAPTSLATTGLFKRAPWEPHCFYPDFNHEIICGDSWNESRLIVATDAGVYLVEDGVSHKQIFDKTVLVKQLHVVEAHGILLFRADKGRDSKIHVFRLSEFDGDIVGNDTAVRSRGDLKEHRLERTRGCTMYSISRPGGSHLRMVVSLGKKILIMQWRHSAAWTAWCPASDTDTVEGFQYIKEIQVPETPSLITLVDSSLAGSSGGTVDNMVCIGYRQQYDIVNERTGDLNHLFTIQEGTRGHLVAAVDLYEDEEPELLLCYNNTCHFQKLLENSTSNEFDFHWNTIPTAIVCAFPYILAFTSDSMEIRLIINGNLVQTMAMPKLTLICSKNDIFFATTAPEFFQSRTERLQVDHRIDRDPSLSPPSSPHLSPEARPFRLYRIPLHALSGLVAPCDKRCPTPSPEPPDPPGSIPDPPESLPKPCLLAEPSRGLSRSCSSSPTPQSFMSPSK